MADNQQLIDGRNQIGKELATLDFANLIGGPLNAVVEAQAKAALTTVNFIKEVAFDQEGKSRQVNFTYTRSDNDGKTREYNLSVPFLTMLPIPYIAVKKASIDFNAKITSTVSSNVSDSLKTDVNANASTGFWFMRAKLQSKVAYQKNSSSNGKEQRTYDLHINVEACNEEMPAGTERLLTILEQSISEQKGVEVFIVQLAPRTDASNTVTLLQPLSEDAVKALAGQKFMLPALVDGNPADAVEFTASHEASGEESRLQFSPVSESGAVLASTVGSLTIRGN